MEEKWKDSTVKVKVSFRMACKFKMLKDEIKIWTKEEREREGEKFIIMMDEIDELGKECEGRLKEDERSRRDSMQVKLASKINLEETSQR